MLFKKPWFHVLLWAAMLIYVAVAPDLFALAFTKHGRPIPSDETALIESSRIKLSIEGFEPEIKDGKQLINLYGWAFIIPDGELTINSFAREIALISDERKYFFPANIVFRNPELPSEFSDLAIDLDTLGFSAAIAEDFIKPGKYRIGIVFRDSSSGAAFYWDKPARYLIRTPNTLRLERRSEP